jgi:hypothetical protein
MRTFLGYVLVAALLAGLYAVIMFVPIYVDHMDAKDLVNSTFNQFRELGPDQFQTELIRRFSQVPWESHPVENEFGEVTIEKGLLLTPEQVLVEFDERTKKLHVRVEYERRVVLKPTQKVRVFKFVIERNEKPPNVF